MGLTKKNLNRNSILTKKIFPAMMHGTWDKIQSALKHHREKNNFRPLNDIPSDYEDLGRYAQNICVFLQKCLYLLIYHHQIINF